MNLIDIHAHLNFPDYDQDREAVIKRTVEAGCGVINVGTDLKTSGEVVALAQITPEFWAAVGIHPHAETKPSEAEWLELGRLAAEEKVVAIGECGLDYFTRGGGALSLEAKQTQKEIFERQLVLAQEVGKPAMLHIREAYNETLEILKLYPGARAHAHFFAGDWELAQKFLDRGITLSVTGVITFATQYDEVIKNVPLEMIMAETDAPYVAPAPYRGERNEPLYVAAVIKKIAELKGLPFEEVNQALLANARRVFALS